MGQLPRCGQAEPPSWLCGVQRGSWGTLGCALGGTLHTHRGGVSIHLGVPPRLGSDRELRTRFWQAPHPHEAPTWPEAHSGLTPAGRVWNSRREGGRGPLLPLPQRPAGGCLAGGGRRTGQRGQHLPPAATAVRAQPASTSLGTGGWRWGWGFPVAPAGAGGARRSGLPPSTPPLPSCVRPGSALPRLLRWVCCGGGGGHWQCQLLASALPSRWQTGKRRPHAPRYLP